MEQGIERGMEEGELRGKLIVAKQMLAEQLDAGLVAKVTGLTLAQIQQLQQQVGE